MTIWKPQLQGAAAPIYQALASAIAEAVDRGELQGGQRLPTQRELADSLGIALTTVTRGYAEAERRGLIRAEVGRGTFVRSVAASARDDLATIDLRPNSMLPHPMLPDLMRSLSQIVERTDPALLAGYGPHGGTERHRTAGARWIEQFGLSASPDDVLVTAGAQHAMAVVLGTILTPGDTLLVEHVTYAGMKALANFLRVRLEPLPMDEEGILPDALRSAIRRSGAAAVYCMSTIQNPTSAVMSDDRRREIAAVTEAYGIPVVEDDTYAFLVPGTTPLTALSSRSFYVTGTSKILLPSLRIGFLRAPPGMADRLEATISSTVYLASPLTAELVAVWLDDGTAGRVMKWKQEEFRERQEIVRRHLAGQRYTTHDRSAHVWIELPEPWTVRDFVAHAEMRGVYVAPSDDFAVGREAPHAVRVCLGPPVARETLERAVRTLTEILREDPQPRKTVA